MFFCYIKLQNKTLNFKFLLKSKKSIAKQWLVPYSVPLESQKQMSRIGPKGIDKYLYGFTLIKELQGFKHFTGVIFLYARRARIKQS